MLALFIHVKTKITMKELFLSFSIAFFVSLCCCVFFIFGSPTIAIIPGVIVMIGMTVLRLSKVCKNGENLWTHLVALLLGNVLLYGSVYCVTYPESKESILPLACWVASILLAGVYVALRKK